MNGAVVNGVIKQWGYTSNDSEPRSLAIQNAAERVWSEGHGRVGWRERDSKSGEVVREEERHGELYQKQFCGHSTKLNPQRALAGAGVKEVDCIPWTDRRVL